ncbi:MAG: hypothetical protein ABIR81_12255, partial [Ginsengibacter sp.]
YIVVGGYAINIQGYQRFTGDMDIWINDTPKNRRLLRKAFKETDMGDFYTIETMQFVPGWSDFHLNNGLRLDIFTSMKGLENYSFDECMAIATIAEIEDVHIPFLHLNQLIENKKAVNRPKDQIDIIELEKIKILREQTGLQ